MAAWSAWVKDMVLYDVDGARDSMRRASAVRVGCGGARGRCATACGDDARANAWRSVRVSARRREKRALGAAKRCEIFRIDVHGSRCCSECVLITTNNHAAL